jgi:hypothetical protein
MRPRTVSLTVTAESEQEFVDLYERLSRQAAGLILDGRDAKVITYVMEEED